MEITTSVRDILRQRFIDWITSEVQRIGQLESVSTFNCDVYRYVLDLTLIMLNRLEFDEVIQWLMCSGRVQDHRYRQAHTGINYQPYYFRVIKQLRAMNLVRRLDTVFYSLTE
jgi:hypothetical protein